jgi:hypothetical protein
MMVIGLKFGKVTRKTMPPRPSYNAVTEFSKRFTTKFGSLYCRDILGVDNSTRKVANTFTRIISPMKFALNPGICGGNGRTNHQFIKGILWQFASL